MKPEDQELYTIGAAAKKLQIPQRSLQRWVKKGMFHTNVLSLKGFQSIVTIENVVEYLKLKKEKKSAR